jgi:hypothetical protein
LEVSLAGFQILATFQPVLRTPDAKRRTLQHPTLEVAPSTVQTRLAWLMVDHYRWWRWSDRGRCFADGPRGKYVPCAMIVTRLFLPGVTSPYPPEGQGQGQEYWIR